jgi:hypothetical protein
MTCGEKHGPGWCADGGGLCRVGTTGSEWEAPSVASRYRKRPVVIEAFQWVGGDTEILDRFLGQNWGRADAKDVPWEHEDDEAIVVWNTAEKLWLPVPVGHWIIRGIHGEFYPCDPAIFDLTYEEVEQGV